MEPSRRQNQQRLLKLLNDHITTVEVQTMLSLLKLQSEIVKDALTTCGFNDVGKLQGEVRAYQNLLRIIQRPQLEDPENKR